MHIKLKRRSYSSYISVYTGLVTEKNIINIHILDSNTQKIFRGISHLNLYILCINKGRIKENVGDPITHPSEIIRITKNLKQVDLKVGADKFLIEGTLF